MLKGNEYIVAIVKNQSLFESIRAAHSFLALMFAYSTVESTAPRDQNSENICEILRRVIEIADE